MKNPSVVFWDIRKIAYVRGLELKDVLRNPSVVLLTNKQFSKHMDCPKDAYKKSYPSDDLKSFF